MIHRSAALWTKYVALLSPDLFCLFRLSKNTVGMICLRILLFGLKTVRLLIGRRLSGMLRSVCW